MRLFARTILVLFDDAAVSECDVVHGLSGVLMLDTALFLSVKKLIIQLIINDYFLFFRK